nr:2'-5' RNA ligase family protein [Bowdeniella massiliensis]
MPTEQQRQVREIFGALEARGFPRRNQTPHITISFSHDMASAAVERAAEVLPDVVPAYFQRVGTGEPMRQAAREISTLNPAANSLSAPTRHCPFFAPNQHSRESICVLSVRL